MKTEYYQINKVMRILAWEITPTTYKLLQRMAQRAQIKTIRKGNGPRAYRYYFADDVHRLATQLDKLPRDAILVGKAAQILKVDPVTVLRKKSSLGAVRHPISNYWLFPLKNIEDYINRKAKNHD